VLSAGHKIGAEFVGILSMLEAYMTTEIFVRVAGPEVPFPQSFIHPERTEGKSYILYVLYIMYSSPARS
jgi:hypothetical protein